MSPRMASVPTEMKFCQKCQKVTEHRTYTLNKRGYGVKGDLSYKTLQTRCYECMRRANARARARREARESKSDE